MPHTSGGYNRYADQRRASRVRVHLPARYTSATVSLEGYVTDLSAEGLFFSSDYLDGKGEVARVSIQIPGRVRPLELRGEVRWVNDAPHASGMGIKLLDLTAEDRQLLVTLGGEGHPGGPALQPGNA
jgi:uncharacterized protein (TIGR02266 family)